MTNPSALVDLTNASSLLENELVQTSLGDWVFPSLNGATFSKSCAHDVLETHFSHLLHHQDRLYIIVGSDSGNLIKFVRSHAPLPRGSRWVFIEPEDIHQTLLSKPDITALLDEYVRLITPDEWPEHAESLQLNAYFRVDGVVLTHSLAALDSKHPAYDVIATNLDAELTSQRFKITANLNQASFIQAQITNTPNLIMPAQTLKNVFEDQTAMILAGGPSLDELLPWIVENRNRLFLIAVSRISGRLQTAGISPDILVTVDPFPTSLMVSRQMFEFGPSTALVACNHAYPGIINRWPGALFYTDSRLPWLDEEIPESENVNSVAPTVTHTAVNLAGYMGFKTIIFAGLDLCHAPNGQTHASGSGEAAAGPLLDYTALRVTRNDGGIGYTTPDYFDGIRSLARIADRMRQQGIECINPSGHAARIDGVMFTPIQAIHLADTVFDRTSLDRAIRLQLEQRIEHSDFYRSLDDAMLRMEEEVGKIERLAQLARESNRAYFHTINGERQHLHHRRMRAIDRLMRRRYGQAETLIKQMAARALLRTDLPHDFFDLEPKQAEALGNHFYGALQQQAHILAPLLNKTRYHIQTRLMELDKETSTDSLIQRYLEGGEPERAFWLARNRDASTATIQPAEQLYQEQLGELIEDFEQRSQKQRSPRASLRLAEMHFSHRNKSALSGLITVLAQHPDQHVAQPYHSYLLGLSTELDKNPEHAFSHYEFVLNHADQTKDSRLIEHCLLRVAAISLLTENADQARQALETAALINGAHWAHAAQLARMQGNSQQAIEALSHYLQQFPGDSRRIVQLAEIFAEEGLADGVTACRELLEFCTLAQKPEIENQLDQLMQKHGLPVA